MTPWDAFYATRPLVIAHRGASEIAPENTLAAFRAAAEADADGIELDVARCATGELMVLHDDCVDRTTNGSGRLETMSFDTLRHLDAGAWFGEAYRGEHIPTLDEVIEWAARRLRVNIEIKGMRLRDEGIEAQVADTIRAHGAEAQVIISSFNPWALQRVRRVAPELQRALICTPSLPGPMALARGLARLLIKPHALHPQRSVVDADYVHWAHARSYRINVWTVNEAEDMRRMIVSGVDGIITNYPDRLRALLGG